VHTSNPVLRTFERPHAWADLAPAARSTMTMGGTIRASAILLAVCACAAAGAWGLIEAGHLPLGATTWGGALAGLVLALIIIFAPRTAPVLAIPFALCEGAFVGGVSMIYAAWVGQASASSGSTVEVLARAGSWIVVQAVVLTFGVFAAMLMAYSMGILRASPAFIKGVIAATGAVFFLMIGSFLLRFIMPVPYLWEMGTLGIVLAGAIVVIAALNLIIDFNIVETGVRGGAPRHAEWYAAFALLVTLVWLYLSILRLLAMLRRQ
jgi:uncharacterized YccA/Bax inhibitor family protein